MHTPVVRAGDWIFGTGLRATDEKGILRADVARVGRPLSSPPKAQREAQFIFERVECLLSEAGGSLGHIARIDQYYPHWKFVDPYHVARKEALKGKVAPSTSIIVDGLLCTDCSMDIQVMAPALDCGLTVEPVRPPNITAPKGSEYAPCVAVGDLIFVAGQLARDSSGDIAPQAQVLQGQLWRGTRIKLETDYLIQHRLIPALEAAGGSLDTILKAQVYLSRAEDLPGFLQVWTQAFGESVPPTTIVPVRHPAFGTQDARLEVNIVATHNSARSRIRDVRCSVELLCPGMIQARVFDNLVFVAGLMAIDEAGVVPSAQIPHSAPYFYDASQAQMADILSKADIILNAAGSSLDKVVRALHFQAELICLPSVYREWRNAIGDVGLPFSAIQVDASAFVPGANLIVDLWAYASS
ncbi:RidA family protein [Microvirga massiliensis]|uniref:RidA family protein n=1 Tax=Microvirga massiliensis TaxID=1033741 RepID=UPI00164D80BC|nr:RidA family protein [Microvirga massiliensis]